MQVFANPRSPVPYLLDRNLFRELNPLFGKDHVRTDAAETFVIKNMPASVMLRMIRLHEQGLAVPKVLCAFCEFKKPDKPDPELRVAVEHCGYDLDDYKLGKPFFLTQAEWNRLFRQMASSVGQTHALGITHGDLNSGNFFVRKTTTLRMVMGDWTDSSDCRLDWKDAASIYDALSYDLNTLTETIELLRRMLDVRVLHPTHYLRDVFAAYPCDATVRRAVIKLYLKEVDGWIHSTIGGSMDRQNYLTQ
jgi:hypothetical protein